MTARLLPVFALLAIVACGKKEVPSDKTTASASAAVSAAAPVTTPAASAPSVPVPPGSPPADGKYERVQVDGVTVPMVQVMNGGAIVLVDTDGAKPRTWEEQYKRKRANVPNGQYDVHKTNANKNDSFDDDVIDREGLWVIDAKGNITKH